MTAPLTIGRAIRCAARRPDKVAIRQGGAELRYGELIRRMDRVAHLAREHYRLEPGDRVLLIAPNDLHYPEIVAGLAEAGVITATLNPALSAAEIAAVADDCEPRLAIAAAEIDIGDLPTLRLAADYEALLARASDSPFQSLAREEDPFALAYTSGTTGAPKGVLLSHRSRTLTFLAMAAEYGCFGPDDHFLAIAPMCHGAGFAFAVAPLAFGGTVSLFEGGDPERLINRLLDGDVTGVFVVPTHVARMMALSPLQVEHGLRTIISNAAALPQAAKEFMIDRFGPGLLHETYGSTEAGIVTNIRPDELLARPGSVGLPFPNMEIELRDEAGAVVAPGEVGELFARGPTGFSGYWRRPDETGEAIRDGWITVGDLARRDQDGFVTILDRKKDMVISGGMNVYPREVETVLAALPGVREAAVVGVPDPEWGERLHAFVVADNGGADTAQIETACRDRLAGYKRPRGISFVAELPRNAGGKILKRVLREALS
jgi:acyl-CoA synthetase (AMP-forming)/AMP-acid ligase II